MTSYADLPSRTVVSSTLLLVVAATWACQEVEHPSPMLTEKQWNQVKEHVDDPKDAPEPEYKIGANFDDKIEFIGFSVGDPDKKDEKLQPGEETTFRWYWKAKEDLDEDWNIFVHFDSKNTNVDPAKRRQNLDHKPLDGLYPTSKWEKGKVIEDVQKVTIRSDYPAGPAIPYVGLYRGKSRLPIENEVPKTNDRRVKAPSLEVASGSPGSSRQEKSEKSSRPSHTLAELDGSVAESISLDGRLDEEPWSSVDPISLTPFGSGDDKSTRVRSFVAGDSLFVGAKLEDEHVWAEKTERDSNVWEEEVFEMFLDVDGDGSNYLELQVNPRGTIFDANFDQRLGTGEGSRKAQIDRAKKFTLEGLESAVHVEGTLNDDSDEDEFWSVELRVPLESIPGLDGADDLGDQWAINFYRYDRPSDGRTLTYGWSTDPRNDFHRVDKFGTFDIAAAGEEEPDSNADSNPKPDDSKKPKLDPSVLEKLRKQNNPVGNPPPAPTGPSGPNDDE